MTEKLVTPTYQFARLDEVIAQHVEAALTVYRWNMTRTADALNVDRRTLYRLVQRHKIQRPAELPAEKRGECASCGKAAPEGDPPAEPGMVWFCSPECTKASSAPAEASP